MALPLIDLDAINQTSRNVAGQQLCDYLRQQMASILRRLPGEPDMLPRFVAMAGQDAVVAGYGDGRLYAIHITISFVLGRYWHYDPAWRAIACIADAPGMDQADALNLMLDTAVSARRQLEKNLPAMHDIALDAFAGGADRVTQRETWTAFASLAWQRGMRSPELIRHCHDVYRADFRKAHGLREAIKHTGSPLDEASDLDGRQPDMQRTHMLLALGFGRFYHKNPLYASPHGLRAGTERPGQHNEHLANFLRRHQKILMEKN